VPTMTQGKSWELLNIILPWDRKYFEKEFMPK